MPVTGDDYANGIYWGYLYEPGLKAVAFVEVRGTPDVYPDFVEYEGRIFAKLTIGVRGWKLVTAAPAKKIRRRPGDLRNPFAPKSVMTK